MAQSGYRILVVEDDPAMVAAVRTALGPLHPVAAAGSIAEAEHAMAAAPPDLLLLDLGLPDGSGTKWLGSLRRRKAACDVIVITGSKDVSAAVTIMKLGARDYLLKPFSKADLLLSVGRAFEIWRLESEAERLWSEVSEQSHWSGIIGKSPAMRQLLAIARKAAAADSTVLITGETGTGKEVLARAIHYEGGRSRAPFVPVNCPQFSATLLESELFGHERGAFTGASGRRRGRFELAAEGTLFLDEIGNVPPEVQAKLLRVLETKRFERVGGEKTIRTDFRLLAATNSDLEAAVRAGAFREDLYYRLNVLRLRVPPLRERREDIPDLCRHFLELRGPTAGRPARTITPEAVQALAAWKWPGNVRELKNIMEMLSVMEDGDAITTRYLPPYIAGHAWRATAAAGTPKGIHHAVMEATERSLLEEYLRLNHWNHRATARHLGMHRNSLNYRAKALGIPRRPPKSE